MNKEYKRLAMKYPFIVLLHKGSRAYYILALMQTAEDEGAAYDSTYKNSEGVWITIDEYNEERRPAYIKGMYKEALELVLRLSSD